MANASGNWPVGSMRDGIRKVRLERESKNAGRDVIAYKVPYRDGNGKQTSQTWNSLKEARQFRDLVRSQKNSGILEDFSLGAQTVSAWAREWLEAARTSKRDSTYESYELLVRRYILPELGGMAVRAVTASDIQRATNSWSQQHSARTVHTAYKVMASMFAAAVRSGLRRASPCVGIQLPETPDREVIPFTPSEVAALSDAMPTRYRVLVLMAALTGLRVGELRGLTWDRVDLRARTVRVDRQMRGRMLRPVKSKASHRTVPLPDALVVELAAYRLAYPPTTTTVAIKGRDPVDVELVFPSPRGKALGDDSLRPYWRAACDAVGIAPEQRRFHNLRHSFASVCIDENKPPKMIQAWMGHASIAVTMDVYGHLMDSSDDALRSGMDRVYGPLLSGHPDPSDPPEASE